MASENVLILSDDVFETEILQADVPALIDFWAEWCMPCKMLTPLIEEIADEYAGRVKVGKMDTDTCRDTAMKFGISAIPTLILFKDGEMVKKLVGLQQKADLKAWRKAHRWHPHQLRHAAGTEIRRQFGLEAAQIVLGHSSAQITDAIYAERDLDKAIKVIMKVG